MIDCHIHLQSVSKGLRERILTGSAERGVSAFFCNATGPHDWHEVLDIAKQFVCARAFIGIHPWFVENLPKDWDTQMQSCLKKYPCGIGEIGLDKTPKGKNFNHQEAVFIRQLELAEHFERPVMIHCVQAWGPLIDIVRKFKKSAPRMIVHSFGGSKDIAGELLDFGCILSFSVRSFRQSEVRQIFKSVPENQFLLETDFPYLPGVSAEAATIEDYQNTVRCVLETSAQLRSVSIGALEEIIAHTVDQVYSL